MAPDNAALEVRVQHLEDEYQAICKEKNDLEERLRQLEISHGRLSERMTLFQLGQAFFTTITATISAAIGVLVK